MSGSLTPQGVTVWHVCPNGIRTSWTEYADDLTGMTCPCCRTSFIYTTTGWMPLTEESP